jgi:cellulose synthase/poly-beta-1,6-N-acetylglucosamine synthase-like glycosyltransferase
MIILAAIFFLLAFNYVIFSSMIHYALTNAPSDKKKKNHDNPVEISVIIAAKNEEKNLPKLIDSLNNLDYPKEKFEIIIVNDNSIDKTEKIISDSDFRLVNATEKNLPAKKGALEIGIKHSLFENILITDADCVVSKNWLNVASKYFSSGTDFLFGAAPYFPGKTFAQKIASFENLRSHLLTFSAALLGKPYSAAGRNFGFKKSAFEKLDGYKNTTETLSGDDDLLLREAVKQKMKIKPILEKEFFVFSEAPANFKNYFRQRARHTKTSHHYPKSTQLFLGTWHMINILITLSVFAVPIQPLLFFPFLIKLTADTTYVVIHQKKFGFNFGFGIPFYQFIYELLLIVHFLNSFFNKDNWK